MKMVMPKMGMTMEEGTIVEWKKEEGEYVEKGEIILEIMTNKVNIEVEAPASGYLKVLKGIDEVVPVGEVIAIISEEAEGVPGVEPEEVVVSEVPEVVPEVIPDISELTEEKREPSHVEAEPVIAGLPEREREEREKERKREKEKELEKEIEEKIKIEKILASPRARKLAEERGIPLEKITGTGPDGAITEKDVLKKSGEKEIRLPEEPEPAPKPKPEPVPVPSGQAVSPLAERIAREKGVDLSQVQGTGIGGKITKEDVLNYIEGPAAPEPGIEVPDEGPLLAQEPVTPVEPAPKPVVPVVKAKPEPPGVEPEGTPLTGIKKVTAERMAKSKREAPHLTLGMEVDMTEASKLKTSLAITYTDILVKATALALKKHPSLNATLTGNKIVLRENINIGVAVARNEDLLVPVIHNADKCSLKEISRLTKDIIERTRTDQLTEKDVLEGTFTISNLGMYDIDFFTPIINPPEAAILGVGAIKKKPVVIDDEIQIRERITLSLSFDHRIVNGVPAALLLKEIRNLLQHPYKLLVEGET